MNVTMLTKIGGYRNGLEWPERGGTIDVPDHEAADLIANGYATPATATEEASDASDPADDVPPAAVVDEPSDTADDDTEPSAVSDPAPADAEDEVTGDSAPKRARKPRS